MAMAGLVGAWMEEVVHKHKGQILGRWSHVGRCRRTSPVRNKHTDDIVGKDGKTIAM